MKSLRFAALAGLSLGLFISPASAVFTYFNTFTNTDWTSVGIGGMRGIGTETINLTGVSGTVTGAYLFWHGPTNSANTSANAAVTFNGTAIVGTNIGLSQDNNWGFANSQAYRADVTSLVSGNGNYSLANFVKDSGNINVNGVSLYVTFQDGNAANNRDLVLFNGNDSNQFSQFDPAGWQVTLNGINYTSGTAALNLTVSDGQNFGNDEGLFINGSTLIGVGPNWQGALGNTSIPSGNGSLWDVKTFDITSFLTPGINNLAMTSGPVVSDALGLIVAAVDLPVGAAPPPPNGAVPEPSTYGLIGAAALLALVARRRLVRR
jgi:hypothetical protein